MGADWTMINQLIITLSTFNKNRWFTLNQKNYLHLLDIIFKANASAFGAGRYILCCAGSSDVGDMGIYECVLTGLGECDSHTVRASPIHYSTIIICEIIGGKIVNSQRACHLPDSFLSTNRKPAW